MTKFSDIGGDVALDFVNTRPAGPDGPVERLQSHADVARWCVQFRLISPQTARAIGVDAGTLRSVHALRETFRRALVAHHKGRPRWRPLIRAINATLAKSPCVGVLSATSGGFALRFERAPTGHDMFAALIAQRIALFLASGDAHRARPCAADDCVLWFVDRTRNHSRHWCRMEGCGARQKARAYYRRKKAANRPS